MKQAYKEQSEKLEGAFKPVTNAVAKPYLAMRSKLLDQNMFYANEGGLATMLYQNITRWCKLFTIKNRS